MTQPHLFDPHTGERLQPKFDPYTGKPLVSEEVIEQVKADTVEATLVNTTPNVSVNAETQQTLVQSQIELTKAEEARTDQMMELAQNTSVGQLTPEQILGALTPAQVKQAHELAAKVKSNDTVSIQSFGYEVQSRLDNQADKILSQANTRDLEVVNESLVGLMTQLNQVTPDDIAKARKKGLFGFLKKSAETKLFELKTKAQTVERSIVDVKSQLQAHRNEMTKDLQLIDQMFMNARDYFEDLNVTIAAGQLSLNQMRQELQQLQAEYERTQDPLLSQDIQNLMQNIALMDQKIHDLILVQDVTLQQGYQLGLMKRNATSLVQKLDNSVNVVIPIWKSQIGMSISLLKSETALKAQQAVNEMTDQLISSVSRQVKDATIATAEANNRDVVSIETVREGHKNLIEAAEKYIDITENGMIRRQQVQKELAESSQRLQLALENAAEKMINAPESIKKLS